MKLLTKLAFEQALKDLMQTKSFDKITVTELVQFMGVNRQTFYYHFKDIYDLLEWVFINDGEAMIGANRTSTSWQEGLLSICHYIEANELFIYHSYHSVNRSYLEHFLYERAASLIKPVVLANHQSARLSAQQVENITDFYKYAFVGFLLDWIAAGHRESAQSLVQRISQTVTILSNNHG
ncbi:TetR/AcrR family transcriptional regulator C-terminal domain-containing protein [Streptococcus gallinaceus]|uniref:Dihydroxyacetone kinase regulator n=1 Tax=Streptococcus gallinaceus TaxID=165758 RepID=A0ABV2JLG4_9STRE|nr:TetR/AcrR family transcriptional regulator C-terminal domain-containing protein [Streptococcus gallinaceus]MCP1639625.1 putative dihydroxyacetone kinase regulator [Streptococcus gallinaceus]MCP1770408.1 putative dihydroxyacetone kinase regulator [Streptococcus gallinaceus]